MFIKHAVINISIILILENISKYIFYLIGIGCTNNQYLKVKYFGLIYSCIEKILIIININLIDCKNNYLPLFIISLLRSNMLIKETRQV